MVSWLRFVHRRQINTMKAVRGTLGLLIILGVRFLLFVSGGRFSRSTSITPLLEINPCSLCRTATFLGRNEVQGDYREAASALGLPTEQTGTHSCRVACATWLYQAGYSIDFIKRHARWVGDSVHVYLWEGSGLHGMVKKMSAVEFTLHTHIF